jgi:phosphatidylinositol kinase/protein kinase (PI-3  family)
MEEYHLLDNFAFSNFDYLLPIHKSQMNEKIFSLVPDTDITKFFYIKADSSETWFSHTKTFSISVAMTSIFGYIIVLGNRHSSHLLIDQKTGMSTTSTLEIVLKKHQIENICSKLFLFV